MSVSDQDDTFARRTAALLLVLGSVMPSLGWLIRPVAIEKHFETLNVLAVSEHPDAWVWSYRFLVFGLFIRLGGLVSFATLFRAQPVRSLLIPGVVIACAGLAIGALQEGYYMDVAIHCAWRFGTDASSEGARNTLLSSLMPLTEWASCLDRMGNMFVALGGAFISLALWRSNVLGRAIAYSGAAVALGIMALIMAHPDGPSQRIAFVASSAWHLFLGVMVLLRLHRAAD